MDDASKICGELAKESLEEIIGKEPRAIQKKICHDEACFDYFAQTWPVQFFMRHRSKR
jgi:hypothetical protein